MSAFFHPLARGSRGVGPSASAEKSAPSSVMGKDISKIPSCKSYTLAYMAGTASMQPPTVVDRKDALATGAMVASKAITGSMFGNAVGGFVASLQSFALLPIMSYAGAGYLIYKWAPWAVAKGKGAKVSDPEGALKRLAKQCQEDYVAK